MHSIDLQQPMSECPMCQMMSGPLAWIVGVLALLVLGAVIAALVSLSVYLVRRSASH